MGYRIEYENSEDGTPTGWTKFYYDENGRKIGEAYVDENGTEYSMTPIRYDANGHEISSCFFEDECTYDANGNLIQVDDAGRLVYQETLDGDGHPYIWTSYTYNSIGELVSEYHWYEPNPEWGGPYTYYYIYE